MMCPKCGEDALMITSLTAHTEVGSITLICRDCTAIFFTLIRVSDDDFVSYEHEKGGKEA